MAQQIYSRYGNPPPRRHGVCCADPSLTKQEFKDDCDINRIMAKYLRAGQLPVDQRQALYGDFSQLGDFQQAQEILLHARKQFEALPSDVRDRFKNDPANMLAFMGDPKNKDEAAELGLLNPPPAPVEPLTVRFAPGENVKIETLPTPPPPKAA